ncbi:hypothetical protein CEP54_015551 [Fusarium duplospermum]|uniref:Uncharacterized protein n=1 Tax=Fusarium duplospermum TaxID=1325734 RepID=A0A428NN74_9HYPO|nr:hypothetical protein CEP54_015551 [Fusarium duplospermum]
MRHSENNLIERVKALEGIVEKLGDLMSMGNTSQPTPSPNHAAIETRLRSRANSPVRASGQDVSGLGPEGGSLCSDQHDLAKTSALLNKFGRLVLHQRSGLSSNRQEPDRLKDDDVDDSDFDSVDDETTLHTGSANHHSYIFGYR